MNKSDGKRNIRKNREETMKKQIENMSDEELEIEYENSKSVSEILMDREVRRREISSERIRREREQLTNK